MVSLHSLLIYYQGFCTYYLIYIYPKLRYPIVPLIIFIVENNC